MHKTIGIKQIQQITESDYNTIHRMLDILMRCYAYPPVRL